VYVAQKKMRVQVLGKDGKKTTEERQPGDPVPEAEHWPDVQRWITQGYIIHAPVDHKAAKMRVKDPGFKPEIRKKAPVVAVVAEPVLPTGATSAEKAAAKASTAKKAAEAADRAAKAAEEAAAEADKAAEEAEVAEAEGADDNTARGALQKLNKGEIVEFAKSEYKLELDLRMSKGDMIDAVVGASEGGDQEEVA